MAFYPWAFSGMHCNCKETFAFIAWALRKMRLARNCTSRKERASSSLAANSSSSSLWYEMGKHCRSRRLSPKLLWPSFVCYCRRASSRSVCSKYQLQHFSKGKSGLRVELHLLLDSRPTGFLGFPCEETHENEPIIVLDRDVRA